MENKMLITGIDIGTTKVVAVIAEIYFENESSINDNIKEIKILGIGEHPSIGLKKGIVVDIIETTKSLDNAIKTISERKSQDYTVKKAADIALVHSENSFKEKQNKL